jgi:hypothetical protein
LLQKPEEFAREKENAEKNFLQMRTFRPEGTSRPTEGTSRPTEGTSRPTEGTSRPPEQTSRPSEGTSRNTETLQESSV